VNGTCMCPAGYTGSSCSDYVCDPPCGNGGYCSYNNSCYCYYGFSGPHCEIVPGPVCGSGYCFHNGTCENLSGNCSCVDWMDIFLRTVECETVSHLVRTTDRVMTVTVLAPLILLDSNVNMNWKCVVHTTK
jgi:hypothetical protein